MDEIALIEIFRPEKFQEKQNHFQLDKGKKQTERKNAIKGVRFLSRAGIARENRGKSERSRGMRQGGGGEVNCHIYIMHYAIKSSKP